MKKIERNKEYYKRLIEAISREGVLKTDGLKEVISKIEDKTHCGDSDFYKVITPELKNILGDTWESTMSKCKREGRYYGLGCDLDEALKRLDAYFPESSPTITVEPEKIIPERHKNHRKHDLNKRGYLSLIWALRIFVKNSGLVKVSEFKRFMKTHNAGSIVTKLNRPLSRRDKRAEIKVYDRNQYKFQGDAAAMLRLITLEYEKVTGVHLDNSEWLAPDSKKVEMPEEVSKPCTSTVSRKYEIEERPEQKYTRYLVLSAIGACQEKGMVPVEVISKFLREWRGIGLKALELTDMIREINRMWPQTIETDYSHRLVKLGLEAAGTLEHYSPKKMMRQILVRVGMGLEDVKRCFDPSRPIKEESVISEKDRIFSIVIDRTYQCERELLEFYKKFRGTDKILAAQDLEKELDFQIELDRARYLEQNGPRLISEFEKEQF